MPLRVVSVAGSLSRETQLADEMAAHPAFELAFRCRDRFELLATIRAGGVDAVLSAGVAAWFDYQCAEEARSADVPLFGLAADPIEADMLEVLGFQVLRDLSHLREVHLPGSVPQPIGPSPNPGKLVAVWGPKGAPGRTTVAVELATVLAQGEHTTLLVDADLYGGDIPQLLGFTEELPSLIPICRRAARGELRHEGWIAELRRLRSGPVVLPGLLRPELWAEVSTFGWAELLKAARNSFSKTVLDIGFCLERALPMHEGGGRNGVAITAAEEADQVLAVVRADPIGLRSFLWALTDHRDLLDRDRLVVLANRVRRGEEVEIARFMRRHLGRSPIALVPDRPDHVMQAVWEGAPITTAMPSSPISSSIREVAAAVGGRVEPRGFLTRLAGRRVRV